MFDCLTLKKSSAFIFFSCMAFFFLAFWFWENGSSGPLAPKRREAEILQSWLEPCKLLWYRMTFFFESLQWRISYCFHDHRGPLKRSTLKCCKAYIPNLQSQMNGYRPVPLPWTRIRLFRFPDSNSLHILVLSELFAGTRDGTLSRISL